MKKSTIVVVAVSLLLLAAGVANAQIETGQDVTTDRLVDHDYLFELTNPGPTWQLANESEVRRFIWGALAAMIDETNGLYLMVYAEPASEVDFEALAQTLADGYPADDVTVELSEAVTYQELPAWRIQLTGTVEGSAFRMATTAVVHRGFLYTLRINGLSDFTASDGSSFEPLWNHFSFIEGDTPLGRARTETTPDTIGVGWRVTGGMFESAAYGIVVEPNLEGWRLCVGEELEAINPDAVVGLCSDIPEAAFIVVAERIAGVDAETFIADLRVIFGEDVVEADAQEEIAVELSGQSTTMARYQAMDSGEQVDFVHGVVVHTDYAIQVIGWWDSTNRDLLQPQLDDIVGQIRLLAEPAREILAARLLAFADPQNAVSESFVLRHGRYIDYEADFTWTKPDGFWEINTSAEAADLFEDSTLFVEAPTLGLTGAIIVERMPDLDAAAYHRAVLELMLPEDDPVLNEAPAHRTVHDVDFTATWSEGEIDGFEQRYLIVTAAVNHRRFQVLVWGLPANVIAAEETAWQIVTGLDVQSDDLLPTWLTTEVIHDERLGFSFRVPSTDWRLEDRTPVDILEFGRFVVASPSDGGNERGVAIVAACAESDEQDIAWFQEIARRTAVAFVNDATIVAPSTVQLAGLPARHFTGTLPEGGPVEAYLLRRGMTYWAIVAFDRNADAAPLTELFSSFELMD